MVRATHYLLPFTPYGEFVVVKPMTINGVNLVAGDPVPKEALGERRLRQLYQQRRIQPAPFDGAPPAYLDNGKGVADKLAAEREAEEAKERERQERAAAKEAENTEGQGDGSTPAGEKADKPAAKRAAAAPAPGAAKKARGNGAGKRVAAGASAS